MWAEVGQEVKIVINTRGRETRTAVLGRMRMPKSEGRQTPEVKTQNAFSINFVCHAKKIAICHLPIGIVAKWTFFPNGELPNGKFAE